MVILEIIGRIITHFLGAFVADETTDEDGVGDGADGADGADVVDADADDVGTDGVGVNVSTIEYPSSCSCFNTSSVVVLMVFTRA